MMRGKYGDREIRGGKYGDRKYGDRNTGKYGDRKYGNTGEYGNTGTDGTFTFACVETAPPRVSRM